MGRSYVKHEQLTEIYNFGRLKKNIKNLFSIYSISSSVGHRNKIKWNWFEKQMLLIAILWARPCISLYYFVSTKKILKKKNKRNNLSFNFSPSLYTLPHAHSKHVPSFTHKVTLWRKMRRFVLLACFWFWLFYKVRYSILPRPGIRLSIHEKSFLNL